MGALGVDSEVKVATGRGGGRKGQLDLARWDDKVIDIGEIKPGHATGLAQGRSDLDHHKGIGAVEAAAGPAVAVAEAALDVASEEVATEVLLGAAV